jgi:mono/diheme cytochrome c family protein
MTQRLKSKIRSAAAVLVLITVVAGVTAWYKLYRDVPQPLWITADPRDHFLYGSVGAESTAGVPYWIWLVLPRMFPEYLHYPGGYAALGLSWEEGREMPVGLSKKTIGFVRVAGNCALCHATSYRKGPEETPEVIAAVPGHTMDIDRLLSFFTQCARDPRFNAGELLAEIDRVTELSFLDRVLYRFVLIPRTRKALLDQSAIVDSALRRHDQHPHSEAPLSEKRMKAPRAWIKALKAPAYPVPVNTELAVAGKRLFMQHCGSCHASDGTGKRMGTVIPIAEIGTDREQLDLWTQTAGRANAAASLGSARMDMVKTGGYLTAPLDGIWLRGPYLHNGSVPTVRDLLEPPARRVRTFYRGNDLIDEGNVGFISNVAEEKGRRQFFLFDTSARGNGNAGHRFGTGLSGTEKDALLEYLKTQ